MQQRILLSLIIVTVFACSAKAVDSFPIGGNASGLRVSMTPHSDNGTDMMAGSDWTFRMNRQHALLHWSTVPFQHTEASDVRTDASIAVKVKKVRGRVSVEPSFAKDRTRLGNKQETADVMLTAAGAGIAIVELNVGIDNQFAPAGKHCTTVILSVTAP